MNIFDQYLEKIKKTLLDFSQNKVEFNNHLIVSFELEEIINR